MTTVRPPQEVPPGRRERKKAATRETLQWAALRLANEHGYEAVTIEAITEAADVSTRTFFNYFSSKDEALLGTQDQTTDSLLPQLLDARPAGEPIVRSLRAVLSDAASTFEANDPMWQARAELLRANPHLFPKMFAGFTSFERALAVSVATRTSRAESDLYPAVVAGAVVAAVRAAIAQWRSAPQPQPLEPLLLDAFDVLAGGLSESDPHDTPGDAA